MASVTFDASHPRQIKIRWNDFEHGFVINGQNLGRHGEAIAMHFFRFSSSWFSRGSDITEQHQRLFIGPANERAAIRYAIRKDPQHPECLLMEGEFSVTGIDQVVMQPDLNSDVTPEYGDGEISGEFIAPFLLGHWLVAFSEAKKPQLIVSSPSVPLVSGPAII